MKEAYQIAEQNAKKTAAGSITPGGVLQPDDRVLVRNLTERGGPGKLLSHWENKNKNKNNIHIALNPLFVHGALH